jgi:hypothetical protein
MQGLEALMKLSFAFAVDVLIVVVTDFHRPKLDLIDIFHPNFSRTDHAYKLFEGPDLLTVGNLIVEDSVMPSM